MDSLRRWKCADNNIVIVFILIIALWTNSNHQVHGLQGVPTWICLGLKSPFIEFKAGIETLSNLSISLNTTDQNIGFANSMMSSNSFSYPLDAAGNHTVQKHYLDMVRKQQKWVVPSSEHPVVVNAMNNKKEVTMIESKEFLDGRRAHGIEHMDQRFIVPLALKTASNVMPTTMKTTTTSTTTTTTRKPPVLPDQSPNIDDLKRHILMLQNLTKNDENFQSKFVVFPSLRRTTVTDPPTTTTTMAPTTMTTTTTQLFTTTTEKQQLQNSSSPMAITRRKSVSLNMPKQAWPSSKEEMQKAEKITIVPQVFLQNDQTPMSDDNFQRTEQDDASNYQGMNNRDAREHRQLNKKSTDKVAANDSRPTFLSSSMKRDSFVNMGKNNGKSPKNNANHKRNEEQLRRRQMRKKCKEAPIEQRQNCTKAFQISFNLTSASAAAAIMKPNKNNENQSNVKAIAKNNKPNYVPYRSKSINLNKMPTNKTSDSEGGSIDDDALKQSILQRTIRSHRRQQQQRRNAQLNSMSRRHSIDMTITSANETIGADLAAAVYKEKIDLNPDFCYKVGGLSYGQQKLCATHTQIMPAISRGARAAIQECKHQFKNRRWNCSTVDDNTVFGAITGLGSPEMAFIHAMAAATAASFIARACRDGQLSTCGCSRSSRPKQLHSDWTWGGCGDDLEFGYKFSQSFIDIRENERKRSQRGLVSVPPKYQNVDNEKPNNDTEKAKDSNTSTTKGHNEHSATLVKPEHLLELQEKITKEILSTKLEENEMHELQAKINHEILNSKVFNLEQPGFYANYKKSPRNRFETPSTRNRYKSTATAKARSKMNIHNNEAGRRAMINKSRITCKCHGVSGSCSLITCWQQLTSVREIGDYLRVKYDEATQVKLNKRGYLQVKDSAFKVPTANDLVYLDESPDWCRSSRQLQWPGTHNRVCNKTSSGLDGCAILCCGRGYNTKKVVIKERCNCKFHWCCHVKCDTCTRVIEEHTCK